MSLFENKKMKKMIEKGNECKCDVVMNLINDEVSYEKYLDYIQKLNKWEENGILELYAGDSYLNDIQEHCEREDRYTISHYYRCKGCVKVFFIGFCCRGSFIFKVEEFPKSYAHSLENINFEQIMKGKEKIGVKFHNNHRFR